MKDNFRIGDMVILQHPTYFKELDGIPAQIVGGYIVRRGFDMHTLQSRDVMTYRVRPLVPPDQPRTPDGVLLVRRYQIRKPRDGEGGDVRMAERSKEDAPC